MAIKVDKGIPIPKWQQRRKYPWREMKVGDSFFVAGEKDTHRMASAANGIRKLLKMEFVTRTEKGGVRVWRVR